MTKLALKALKKLACGETTGQAGQKTSAPEGAADISHKQVALLQSANLY